MKRYRILTDGEVYIVEIKHVIWWVCAYCDYEPDVLYFFTEEQAENNARSILGKDAVRVRRWRYA